MNDQKVFFPTNLKYLRERKKISQEALAGMLGFTRAKLAALESGATKAVQPEDFVAIATWFKISIDSLLKVDLKKLGELKMRDLEAGNDVYTSGGKLRVLAITVDSRNKENIEFVPIKAKAGYRAGFNDPEFIAGLPRFSMPGLEGTGTYRMFPTVGDSMLPIPEGSNIVTQYVEDWTAIKPGTLCIVILKGEQDFVFKQVTPKEGGFVLSSLNPVYEPYEVASDEVLEIWKYQLYQSAELPEPLTDLQHVSRKLNDITTQISRLAKD